MAREWPEAALREARRVSREHEPDGERADLLELEAITIDPPTARDFDDAISIEPDGDGVRAWVHIADVASYVKPGGALDAEAGRRTCSVYVPGIGRADAAARALGRRLQPAPGRGAARGQLSSCASAPTASPALRASAAR